MPLAYDILTKLLGDDYFTEPEVPILDEHILTDRAGKNEMMVDAAFLNEIAANNNARVEQTGDPTPLIIGHTEDGPGKEEKKVVGYATNFRLQPFFDSGRQALFADFHFRKENRSIPQDYPRRSVELWPKKREIDPISLLGGTTPERDLGILRFARDDAESLSIPFNRECIKMADEKKTNDVKDAEKGETSGMRSIEAKLDQLLQLFAGLMEESGQPQGEPDGDEKPPKKDDKKPAEQPPEEDADDLLGPAGQEEMPPGEQKESAEYHDTPVKFGESYLPKVTKMSRENDEVIKLQRRVKELEKKAADEAIKFARLEAAQLVADLETNEGIVFATKDMTIDMIARLSGEAKKHYVENEIKKNYARDLTRVENDLTRYSREATGDGRSKSMKEIQAEIDSMYNIHANGK